MYECESPSSDPIQPQNGLKELVWDFYFSFRQQVFTSCTFLIFMREHATSIRKHVRDYAEYLPLLTRRLATPFYTAMHLLNKNMARNLS